MHIPAKLLSGASAVAILMVGVAMPSLAQDQSTASDVIEEIYVTSQKREKTLLETPIAISVFSGDTLAAFNIRDIRDLQTLVPSYNLTQSQTSFQTTVNIRGLGTSGQNPGLEPSVGIFVDGVFRSRTGAATGDFLSVERIEVLRGPQSTLFGKNTSAGVLSIITMKPQFEAGGRAEVTYGNFDQVVYKATITGPLTDTIALRMSGNLNKRDGFITNVADGTDLNNRDRWAIRGQLLFTPADNVSLRIIGDYAEANERCCAAASFINGPAAFAIAGLGGTVIGALPGPGLPFERNVAINTPIRGVANDFGLSAQLDWDYDTMTFTSITAYREFESDADFDADFTDLDIIGATGSLINVETFTQEFRLASTGANEIDWLVGAFYFNQDLTARDKVLFGRDTRSFFDLVTGPQTFSPFLPATISQLDAMEILFGIPAGTFFADGTGQTSEFFENGAESYAIFGQVDYHLDEKTTLTVGLRYTKEDKTGKGTFTNNDVFSNLNLAALSLLLTGGATDAALNGFLPLQFLPSLVDFDRKRKENKLTGNVIVSYDVNEDLTTYGSYSRGYKAGGFDLSRGASTRTGTGTNTFEFRPETVSSLELGAKARFLQGRGRINVAVYRQIVKDFQSNLFTGTGFELRNAGTIKVQGIEVDAHVTAVENLDLNFAMAYNDAIYLSFTGAACPVADLATICDLTGQVPSDSPKLTFSSSAIYTMPITDDLSTFLMAGVYYRGSRFTDSDNDPNNFQTSTLMLNGSFGIQGGFNSPWQLVFWVKNLTKENYAQIIFDTVVQDGSFSGYPNDPRTFGVTLRGSF